MKIAYINNPGGRDLFAEGLPCQDGVDPYYAHEYLHNGKRIPLKYVGVPGILNDLETFDLIITQPLDRDPSTQNWNLADPATKMLARFEEKKELWDRVAIWDWRDGQAWWDWGRDRCIVYFKKDLNWPRRTPGPKIYPLTWPAYDLYFEIVPYDLYETNGYCRDIDIGYYFGERYGHGHYRAIIRDAIRKYDWTESIRRVSQFHIDFSYTSGARYQGNNLYDQPYPYLEGARPNTYWLYWHLMRRTKVVFNVCGQYGDYEFGGGVIWGRLPEHGGPMQRRIGIYAKAYMHNAKLV